MSTVADVWDATQLMGGMSFSENGKSCSIKGKGVSENAMLWGVPGHLTPAETECFMKFKACVEKRGGDFRDTVYSFGEIEGEAWALSRWCRARKFVYDDIIKMVEEATEVRKEAKSKNFYPNPVDALGCEASLFFAQYPQVYSGYTKMGVPVFISKPGILNVDGMECITTLDGILKFHWYVMMHDFANRLRSQKQEHPDTFKRFECFCILDLENLTTSQLSQRALSIIKEQSAIDSICFPETMHKMLIVNAPTFFSATWRLIKGWLDARTANKIEVISSRATMENRLLEFIDADQLPSDYGGKAQDSNTTMMQDITGDALRFESKMLYVRGHASEVVDVAAGESLDIEVYTRSTAGASFQLTNADTKGFLSGNIGVKHGGTDDPTEMPTSKKLTLKRIDGPIKVKVKADSNAGRFSRQNFLLVFSHFKI